VVRWHYHWLVIHDFLARTVGPALVDDILVNGPLHYSWRNDPFIPVEFSVAAYRFGHWQVRPSYRANFGASPTDRRSSSSRSSAIPRRPTRLIRRI
jgi:hypothetical protein